MVKKFGDDRGSHLAKLLAYSGFFSMFPLMLASVSVIGLVLKDDPELQKKMIDSALSSIPVLGTSISETSAFDGSGLVLVLSILLAFWAGLGLPRYDSGVAERCLEQQDLSTLDGFADERRWRWRGADPSLYVQGSRVWVVTCLQVGSLSRSGASSLRCFR
ncbi:MAG: YhjD/YihY/BrkB family envelope integrity protein [Microthrixaceae bacterium]